ncbi:MAG: lipopolysaccharide heptosyltransferase II [Candidatus Omnitrophota bacterium]
MKPPDKVRKILVVTLSNIGDVILTLPVFQSLLRAYPGALLHAVVGEGAKEVLEGDARITQVIPYNKRMSWSEKFRFIRAIRGERFDLIVDLRKSLIGLFGGGRFRNSYLDHSKKSLHRAKRHLRALEGLVPEDEEGSFFDGRPVFAVSEAVREAAGAQERRLVLAAPGSKSDIKKWPAEHFARLLDRLILADHCRVVLVGDKADAADAGKVKSLMTERVTDLCGKTNLKELEVLLKHATMLVTNDSAPLHLADALKTPTVAIFGPTDPRKYGPRHPAGQTARRELFCSPCEKAQCRFHHECLKELGPEEVYRKARLILDDEYRPKNFNVLVVRLDRIGDVVLSLRAVRAIRDRFPNARISMMVRPYTRELVEGHPLIDEVIPYYYEKKGRHSSFLGNLRFIREIARRRFDVAFILHPGHRAHLVPFCANIPYRVGFASHASSFFLTKQVPDRRREGAKHESEYTLDIVRAFGIEPSPEKKAELPVFPEDARRITELVSSAGWGEEDRIVAIHPGASCPSKRWPAGRFEAVGKKILEETPWRVAIVGGNEEASSARDLARRPDGALDLSGRLSLRELAAFLSRCAALVSNDSGPVHIASAVGTPTVTIFGRNQSGLSPVRWKALGAGHHHIQKNVGCVVCLAHRCTIDFECLRAIEVEEVFGSLREVMEQAKASEPSASLRGVTK